MKKNLFIVLTLLLSSLASGQWKDDCNGGAVVINNDRYGWKTPTGTVAASNGSMQLDGSGYMTPYHASGAINYGYVVKDSPITTYPLEVWAIFGGKGGTNNSRYLAIGLATSTNFGTSSATLGYLFSVQEMTTTNGGTDQATFKMMNSTMPTLGGSNPAVWSAETRYINHEFVAGDTIGLTLYSATGPLVAWVASVGGSRDSTHDGTSGGPIALSGSNLINFTSTGAFFWTGGAVLSPTTIKWDEVGIRATSGGTPPPAATDNAAPDASFLFTSSYYLGQSAALTVSATDDSALNQSIVEVDTGVGGYHTITTNTYAGTVTAGSFTSASFTRWTVGSATVRVRTSDHNKNNAAIRWDTTATQVINFSQAPVASSSKIRFGWLTFEDTKWPAPYASGTIPADSLPWSVLTHVGLFAANGNIPPQSYYTNQYKPMADYAHARGVYAGITVGGESDAALVSMIGNPASWNAWINAYVGYLDAAKADFIDFDLEGSYTASNVVSFFNVLYDTLNASWRSCGNNPSKKPFIVLTAGVTRAISWVAAAPKIEFVNLMTYDYNNDAWGRVTFDCSPKSYRWYNATGGATDSVGTGVNAIAPSHQRMAIRVNAAGWPMNKLNVGLDVNGGGWGNASQIRQSTAGTTSLGSGITFSGASGWTRWSTLPADSIFFDTTAQAYWARVGTELWTWLALPDRPLGVRATRKVVDSMGLAGICVWNLGLEGWDTSPTPPGGSGWFFSQLKSEFGVAPQDTNCVGPAAPGTPSPADLATGVSVTPTLDVADAATAVSYRFQVSTNSSFGGVFKDTTVPASQLAIAAGYLLNNTDYWWRVRGNNSTGCAGAWSPSWKFTTLQVAPARSVLLFPANAATNQSATVVLNWTDQGSVTYGLMIDSTDSNFTHLVVNQTGLTVPNYTAALQNGKTYFWKVRATNGAGPGTYSYVWRFTTAASAPGFAVLSSPPNNASGRDTNNLLLSWGPAVGATSYRLQVDDDPGFLTPYKDTVTSGTSYSLWGLTGNRSYWWRVNATNSVGSSGYTSNWTFTTTSASPVIVPRLMGRWVVVWIPEKGAVLVDQPPDYFGMKRVASLSDIPTPATSDYDWFCELGLVQNVNGQRVEVPFGGSGGSTGIQDGDTVNALVIAHVTARDSIIITGSAGGDTTQKIATVFKINPSAPGNVKIYAPAHDGILGTIDGHEDYLMRSATLDVPLDQNSGGFAMTPTQARNAGLATGVWCYDATVNPPAWTLVPYTSLATTLKLVSWAGISSGAWIPILTANGVVLKDTSGAWKDSVGSGTGTADGNLSALDPDSTNVFLEEFDRAGMATNIAGDGTINQTVTIGRMPWVGAGFGGGATTSITLNSYAEADMPGAIVLDPGPATTMGTERGGVITNGGSASNYAYEIREPGVYKFRFKTPTTEDSVAWAMGIAEKRADAMTSVEDFTNTTELLAISGGSISTAPDTIFGFVIGSSNINKLNLLTPYSANSVYKGMIVVGASDIKFYLTNASSATYNLKATVSTNLPATGIFGNFFVSIWNYGADAAATGKDLKVDFYYFRPTTMLR